MGKGEKTSRVERAGQKTLTSPWILSSALDSIGDKSKDVSKDTDERSGA